MGVSLRDIITNYKTPIAWDALAGVAAVDAHNALYQFLSIIRQPDGTPLMDQTGRVTSHLSGILFRAVNFMEKGIRPVWVFDGTPPEFKQETINQRRSVREQAREQWRKALERGEVEEAAKHARASSRIDDEVIATSKSLISLLGMPSIDAPSEGEAQAASVLAVGQAEAEAMDRRAEAFANYNDAAVLQMLIEVLPQIAEKIAAPMGNIETLTVLSTEGASALPKAVTTNMMQTLQMVKDTTGFDLNAALDRFSAKEPTAVE